ncbi:MAG TPA: hypothetical protein VEX70_07325 [Pyrinomonadaceae bacterium]|jgi:hypothetical protein|nr:hypothetical protein [Pyrinomonadaceae bacterium]
MALFIERYFAISMLAVGLSHIAMARQWRDFFLRLKATGVAGIIIAMFTFPLGLLIVLGHNVWVLDLPVIVTICGWGMTLKSATYALVPGQAERMIPEGADAHRKYVAGGFVALAIGALLLYHSFFRAA